MENLGNVGECDKYIRQIEGKKIPSRSNFGKRWHRFRALTSRSFILRGSYAMSDRRFKYKSQGRQAAPCSVVAIVYGRLFEPKEWTRNHIDQVLEYGDKLFRASLMRSQLKDDEYMRPNLVDNEFYIGFYKILVSIEDSDIHGNLFSESVGCSNFAEGLRKFFKNNDSAGVITTQGSSVAVWRQSDDAGFFYYDPASCDEVGLRQPGGTACLMRFKSINDLHDHLLKNLNWRYDSRFCISKVAMLRATEVGRGCVDRLGVADVVGPPVVRKSGLRSIPVDVDDHKVDCTKSVPREEKVHTLARIRKEPLSIIISNYSIDRRFATELLVNRNVFDTGYSYDDMRVNVPSTFIELPGKIAILHGLTHEGNEMYKGKGGQNVANCVMAIAMNKVHPVKTWTRSKLDEILMLGDSVYANVKSDKPIIKTMTAADLDDTKIQIEDRKLVIDVDLITVTGTISSKIPSVLNLKQALEEFFLLNEEGVIETTSMAVAVWSQDDRYYLFDPRHCDAAGIRIREEKTTKVTGKDKKEEVIQKEIGNCCVIRFPDVDSLVPLFLKNIDPTRKNDRFIIRHVRIVDDVPGTRTWNEFQPGMVGKTWVLRGGISNVDESLEEENQGRQGLAMPVVALVSAKETPAAKWSSETVDEVIREGDAYYNWCKPVETEEETERLFLVQDLKKNLYFKNRKVTIDVEEATVVGDLWASDDSKLPNLEEGLRQFFESKNYGIVETKRLSVAVWKDQEEIKDKDKKEETFYYYFDPNPRDKLGQLSAKRDEENSACLVRSSDLSALADLIKKNAEQNVEGENDFMIHELKTVSIGALMTNEEIEMDKQKVIVPDLNNYSNLGNTGALLLGTIDQRNESAFKRQTRDKQQAANSLTTLAMTKLYDPHLWYRELVDDILRIGDKLTIENLMNLPEAETEEEPARNYLLPSEITEDFVIGVNRMSIDLEEESVTGRMTDVTRLLEEFFERNAMGVFRQGDVMMPIWRENRVFFTMDPRGRNTQGEPREKDGAAAVMWFTDILSLAGILRAVTRETDDFVIDAVSIENVYETRVAKAQRIKKTTSGEDLWHHFPKLIDGVWSIDGNVTMTDERFEEANRGKQSAAIAAIAIVFSKVYQPRQWTPSVLDQVIITGDKLHSKCVERLDGGSVPLVNEIINEFFLSSRRIALTIKDCVQAGDLIGRPPKIQNLQTGIDNFFNRYEAGALTARRDQNLAIWKADNAYYALIPDWSITTKEMVSMVPRVFRFKDTSLLVEYLLRHLGTEGDYQITAIDVLDWSKPPLWKLDPSPAIRLANLPPLNAYKRLRGDARAILHGSYHQGDEIFPETLRGRQTAANCAVALGMSVVKSPVTWTKKTMDEILAIGSGVYQETRKTRPTESRPKPTDIIRIFYVGVNVLTVDIEPRTVSGLVTVVPFVLEDEKKGREETREKIDEGKKRSRSRRERPLPPSPIPLEEGLRKFFQDNRAGILVTDRGTIAIWKELGVYFMYDPRAKNDQGLPDSRGTSCVMWFACMEPLYDTILASIDPSERHGTFEICRVIVRNVVIEALPCPGDFQPYLGRISPPVPITYLKRTITLNVEPLNEYNVVDEELSVLRGSLHMNHRTFSLRNRGLQSTAIAAVAVVVGLLHAPSTWTSKLIDAVLEYGDSLYSDSVRVARSGARSLSPSELLTVFIVGDSRVTVHVNNHTTAGILHAFDLSEALAMFFRANCAGILHTSNLAVAVMQHYGKFYMFDPCSRNDRSRSVYDGAACMFKCDSIARMAKMFVANCNVKRPNVYTLNAVNVSSLHFFSTTRDVCPFER